MKRALKLFPRIFVALCVFLIPTWGLRGTAAATLKADYQFQDVRTSAVAGAPVLTDVGAGTNAFATETVDGVSRRVLTFPQANGLSMVYSNGFISNTTYSLVILCRVAKNDGRILNPKVGTLLQASGLFVLPPASSSDLNTYFANFRMGDTSDTGATPIALNQYVQLVCTRGTETTANGVKTFVTGYVNGQQQWKTEDSGTDPNNYNGVIANNTLHFFKGDTAEETAGAVARIRVYDGALTANEVAALPRLPAPCPTITLSPTTANLPNATVGTAYSQTITASGGTAPYTFTQFNGTMPAGLTLSSTGKISGTPTKVGDPSFSIRVTDANGCFGGKLYTISVRTASGTGTGDGHVAAWGYNSDGAYGNGNTDDSIVPVAVINSGVLANKVIKALAGGDGYSLALTTAGKVYGWGDNTYGQLGDGTSGLLNKTLVPIATQMSGLPTGVTFKAIAASQGFITQHSLGLGTDGKVYAWGSNYDGQLGDGSATGSDSGHDVPTAVSTSVVLAGKTIVAIACGEGHSLAVDSNGQAYAWGSNQKGELGDGSTPGINAKSTVPVAVAMGGLPVGTKFVAVAAGEDFSLALTEDGKIYSWGDNGNGALGSGADLNTNSNVPVAVKTDGLPVGTTFKAISAGIAHVLALATDGKAYAWGDNDYGQLGTGQDEFDLQNSNVPLAVDTGKYSGLAGKSVTAIATGGDFSLALADDGKVYDWGDDAGALGTGNDALDNQYNPVAVYMNGVLDNKIVTVIGAGSYHSLAATAATDRYTAANCPSLPPGIKHWWRGDGNAWDSVGSADGAMPGAEPSPVTFTTGKVREAFNFDGTTYSRVVAPGESYDITLGTTFSVELWVFPKILNGTTSQWLLGDVANDTGFGQLSILSDHFEYWQNSVKRVASAAGTAPLNTWTHVALTYDGSVTRLYTNGVLRATSAVHSEAFNDTILFGDAFGDTFDTHHFTGMLDEIALYNTAISQTQIQAIVDAGNGGKCLNSCPTITLSPSTLPNGFGGAYYNQTITASGGTGPYTFTKSGGTLPGGVSLSAAGVLSGSPTAVGTYNFTVKATDTDGCTGTRAYTLVVPSGCVTPASGLVHWWPGEGDANDAIGNADGTIEVNPNGGGPVTFDPGKVGKAFGFDYSGNDVSIPSINLGNKFTIEFWWYEAQQILSDNYNYERLIANDGGSATNFGALLYRSAYSSLEYWQNGQYLFGVGNIYAPQWYHIAFTSDGATLKLYVNGELKASAAGNITFNNPSKFGSAVVGYGHEDPLKGNLDEISYYNVELSQAQIQAIYDADAGGKCIPCPTITLAPGTLPNGGTNNVYSQTITASGGIGSYTFAKSAGTLPTGLTLASTGKLSGTPTAQGTFNFTVKATDSGGCTGTKAYAVTIISCSAITLSPGSLPDAVLNQSYSKTLTASGGSGSYTFAKITGELPPGLNLSAAGVLSGTPTVQGTFTFKVQATDASGCSGTRAYTVDVCTAITLAPVALPDGTAGTAYSKTITASGGTAPYTFAKSAGTLPTGLTLTTGGVLSGTPSAGSYNFTVRATDANGCSAARAYTVSFCANLTLSPATLPNGKVSTAYNQTLTPAGGTAPITIAKTAGTLPPGLTLSAGGVLSGTPTLAGIYNFTVTVIDANGLGCARSRVYRLIVNPTAGASGDAVAWGRGVEGQLGIGLSGEGISRKVPVDVDAMGVLNGKLVTAVASGDYFSLALTSDGKVYAWGKNTSGALGDGNGGYDAGVEGPRSTVPIAVDMSGALAGKTVVAIAASSQHALALTFDGKVYAWGWDAQGQAGDGPNAGGYSSRIVPVAVNVSGALAGKTVIAIAAGGFHSLALTSDGKVYAWGSDNQGQLGDGPNPPNTPDVMSDVPVAVSTNGALNGKHVTAIAAGYFHSLALTSDGKVYSWGYNYYGQLGTGQSNFVGDPSANYNAYAPVAVRMSGPLKDKIVTALAAGIDHSLVLTSEGKMAAWGFNTYGQLGNNSFADSAVPVAVRMSGPLNGNTAIAIAAGDHHNLGISSQGKACAWGDNTDGQLGNGSNTKSATPVAVKTNSALADADVTAIDGGGSHSLAIAAGPCPLIALAPQTPLSALVGVSYNQAITASGGKAPYTFKITGGQLPAEFTFSAGGVLSGTASVVGSHTFTVQATDATGCTGRRIFTLNISGDCDRLPSGIVGWWKGQSNANDSIGTNHGTASNVTYAAGEVGSAFRFTTVSSLVDIPDAPALRPAQLTLEAWIKYEALEPADQFGEQFIVYKNAGFAPSYALMKTRIQKGDGTKEDRFAFRYQIGGSSYYRPLGKTKIEIGQFYHVVGTFDGEVGRLYVNGVLEDEFANPVPGVLAYDSSSLRFGSVISGGNGFFVGRLDEVALYNRALDIEEIQALHQAGTNGKCGTYVVINTNDSGTGSLRAAINYANSNPGATVRFNIPETDAGFNATAGTFTIRPLTPLPVVTASTVVDGSTQRAFTSDSNTLGPEIVVNGASAGTSANGLQITAANCVVRELAINGFALDGVRISGTTATGNSIEGCYIGAGGRGTSAVANNAGIHIQGGAHANIIGTASTYGRNLISGNTLYGVWIEDAGSNDNQVLGNYIGTNRTGAAAIANGAHGVYINGGSNNIIGRTTANARNRIAFNGSDGIFIAAGAGNALRGNLLFSNTGLGIDLAPNGVTANDSGDGDAGANALQNSPVITSVTVGTGTTIIGTLNSTPNSEFEVDVYRNPNAATAGAAEGELYVGTDTTVTTDGSGNATFRLNLGSDFTGQFFTATANRESTGNTSEFSPAQRYVCPSITLAPTVLPNGTINVAYSKTITASAGTGPYSFTVSAGNLPPGLSLETGGVLSGTPTTQGSFNFTVKATDARGCTGTQAYTVLIAAPCVTPPANMVSWWPGDGNANDIQGTNHGTFSGNANATATGMVGQAFSFMNNPDDLSDSVYIANPASLKLTQAITIDAWIKPVDVPNAQIAGIFTKWAQNFQDTSTSDSYGLWLLQDNGVYKLFSAIHQAGAVEPNLNGGNIPLNAWSHVAMTFDATSGQYLLYVNGQQVATTTAPGAIFATDANIMIGREASSQPRLFHGAIDEVEIFSRALSSQEIAAIYNAGPYGKCKPSQ